ncbi:MAG TPA: DUF1501 domain-containing protein [Pirellulales bacterium]|jgi:hypothetical protein|nr:DUF1501 domain-containing protein [Pirellulales bacterium]
MKSFSRREFLQQAAAVVSSSTLAGTSFAAPGTAVAAPPAPTLGKAEACIFIWLGGGAAQLDTFDPKRKGDGQKIAGSYYDAIDTAIPGVQVCEHLARTAPLFDRCVPIRTVFHHTIDEHAAAVNLVHTGRPTSGTVVYPSIGSIVAKQRGPAGEGVPTYVVMGYPNVTRGPGFLGAKHGYVYLLETEAGPAGLKRPASISAARQARRAELLDAFKADYVRDHAAEGGIASYADAMTAGFKLAGPRFMNVFNLKNEPDSLRNAYGSEFGQRLLLARRLVQSGVRFVEVSSNLNFINGTGWDTHNEGQLKQHELIRELDQGFSTLLVDLEKQRLLDKTLIVIATEFGRPAEFDAGGGRGHQATCFSTVLAGGGIKSGQAIGVSDELGKKPVERPVSLPDLHATIHTALGIDPNESLYAGDRPIPITDQGRAVAELFA